MKTFHTFIAEASLTDKKVLDVEAVLQDKDWYGGGAKADQRTRIFESTACIVAMKGTAFKEAGLRAVMNDSECDPVAKDFYTRFLKEFGSDAKAVKALLDWIVLIGGPTAELRPIKSFIQKSINDYYKAAPKSFEVAAAVKTNTTDIILIVDEKKETLFSLLDELKTLDSKDPNAEVPPSAKRISTTKKGMCSILDSNRKKILSFYQVSLKKGTAGEAQAGKAGAWLNKNYLKGVSLDKPKNVEKLAKELGAIPESALVMIDEGFLDFVKGKLTAVIKNVKNFSNWASQKLNRLPNFIVSKSANFAKRLISRNKGIKAAENILSYVPVPITEEYFTEKPGSQVKINESMLADFKVVRKEFLKKKSINLVHQKNVKLFQTLNKKHKVKGRDMEPIIMLPDINAGIISTTTVDKQLVSLTKKKVGDFVSRDELGLIFKLGSNFAANVAIFGILKGVETGLLNKDYDNLSSALFALAAKLEAEVRFGNTALPLVIVYGGKKGKLKVMGKREDWQELRKGELTKTGKDLTNFPWLVLRIGKAGGKEKYNTVSFKLISQFVEEGDIVVPEWLGFGVRTNSGSNFTCTIEASTPTKNWQGRD